MYSASARPSPLELVLARMKRGEESPWGRLQELGHRWLTRIEGNRLLRAYHSLVKRAGSTISLRSEPVINLDSVFFLSLFLHLLLLLLLSWITFSSKPLSKPGLIHVRFMDLGKRAQPAHSKPTRARLKKAPARAKKEKSRPERTERRAPARAKKKKAPPMAPKPVPALPAPKVLAEVPREILPTLAPKQVEPLVQLPTRQISPVDVPKVQVQAPLAVPKPLAESPEEDLASLEAGQVKPLLPSSEPRGLPTPQVKLEAMPITGVDAALRDELKIPRTLLRGESPEPAQASRSALSSPDFASYLEKIKRKVQSAWEYPEGISGTQRINLLFVLDVGGNLVRVEVLDSTDSRLKGGAVKAMRRASPFPPIPENLKDLAGWPLRIRFTIDFGVKVAR